MATADPGRGRKTLPIFTLFGNKELYLLGRKENWKDLELGLGTLDNGEFWIRTPEEEAFIDVVRDKFDESKNADGDRGAVHYMVGYWGGDNGVLLQLLLSLGVRPDLPDVDNWRSSHVCGSWARPDSAAAIAACRPDMAAMNENSDTPLEAARTPYTVII
jgi:hypothetical protein